MKFFKLLDCDYFCNPSEFDEVFLPFITLIGPISGFRQKIAVFTEASEILTFQLLKSSFLTLYFVFKPESFIRNF